MMFRTALRRHLFRQTRATLYLEGIALAVVRVKAPRRRRLFGV